MKSQLSGLERRIRGCVVLNVLGSNPELAVNFCSVQIISYCNSFLPFSKYQFFTHTHGYGQNKEKGSFQLKNEEI